MVKLQNYAEWQKRSSPPYEVRTDHRNLVAIRHGWAPSKDGDSASIFREVQVPSEWTGPVFLSFYCSDDYEADQGPPAKDSWLTAEGYVGHRFKQILINSSAVWSQDVADPVTRGKSGVYRVPIPAKPGERFLLTALVYDAKGSETILDGDYFHGGKPEKVRNQDPDGFKFGGTVWWGDFVMGQEGEDVPGGVLPSWETTDRIHKDRWPVPGMGKGAMGFPIALTVTATQELPSVGFPCTWGVPFGEGRIGTAQELRASGCAIDATCTGKWSDDSLQWASLDLIARKQGQVVKLSKTKAGGTEKGEGIARETEGGVVLRGSPINSLGFRDGLLGDVVVKGKSAVVGGRVECDFGKGLQKAEWEEPKLARNGKVRADIERIGHLSTEETKLATIHAVFSAFSELPYLRITIRILNDTQTPLNVSALRLFLTLPHEIVTGETPLGDLKQGSELLQTSYDTVSVDGKKVATAGPMFVKAGSVTAVIKRFRERFPRAFAVKGSEIVLDCMAGGATPVKLTSGETSTHEIWLALGDIAPVLFSEAVEHPPILTNPEYYCSTGVLGPAATHSHVEVLRNLVRQQYGGKSWGELGHHYGLRDFPDSPYYGGLPEWQNNYYEKMLGSWSEWFMSGEYEWAERAGDVCAHILDTAVVHSTVPGQDWLGAMHGPGKNHVAGPWAPTLRTAGLAVQYRMTGDNAYRDAFLGVADYCVRSKSGLSGDSSRVYAGPLDALCTAYMETGEPQFLDEGAARVEAILGQLEHRRGAWPEKHGSAVYFGNVPWMLAQVARPLYLWYRLTGDVRAARAVVAMADSIVCENTDWDKPGFVSGYSHNPRYAMTAQYDLLILPVIFAAYELTDDVFFLDAAKAQWKRWIENPVLDSPFNCYWNTPWLMHYLQKKEWWPERGAQTQ